MSAIPLVGEANGARKSRRPLIALTACARNRNQTSDQRVGSCKSLIRASDQTFCLNPAELKNGGV